MRILVVGSDRKIFDPDSTVALRQKSYAGVSNVLDIIVFARRSLCLQKTKLADSVSVYPANSLFRWLYILDALLIARCLPRPDVVSTQDPFESGLAGYFIAKYFKAPLYVQIHTDFASPYFYSDSLLNKIRFFIAQFIIPRAKSIRAVSGRIKKSLIQSGLCKDGSKIQVLPIYVDVNKIKESPIVTDLHKKYSQFKFVILMASRLTKEKNIGLAINAMREIVKKFPEAGLIIVGDGPEKESLNLLTAHHKLTSVIFEPWTNDLASYYKTADLFLLTSNYEGYGMTAIEALAAGTPVVMSDVGCAGDIVVNGQNGLIFAVGDLRGLVGCLYQILFQRLMLDNFRLNIAKMVWRNNEEKYLQDYVSSWELCANKK